MAEKRLARHNVVGVFARPDCARAALAALGAEGIGPPETSLLAPDGHMPPGARRPRRGHGSSLAGVGRHLLAGVSVGTLVGALLGALAGALVALLPGVTSPAAVMATYAAVAGAVMGHVAGALVALEAAGRRVAMWEQSLHPLVPRVHENGDALVGLHTRDPARAERAAALLRDAGAGEVRRLDADEAYRVPGTRAALVGDTVPSDSPASPGGALVDVSASG